MAADDWFKLNFLSTKKAGSSSLVYLDTLKQNSIGESEERLSHKFCNTDPAGSVTCHRIHTELGLTDRISDLFNRPLKKFRIPMNMFVVSDQNQSVITHNLGNGEI